jgi:4-amino-4-deoxy-L-arabinose transferase-like glycosyltransferase
VNRAVPTAGAASNPRRRPTVWLAGIVGVALALRVAFVLATLPREPVGDETTYDSIAANVSSGRGYQLGNTAVERTATAMRGPSYVLELALLYRIFGRTLMGPLLVQAVLDSLACVLVFELARRWFRRPGVGLVAACLVACYPPSIQYAGSLLTESFTTLTLLSALLAWQIHVERGGRVAAASCGLALGLCALNRPQLAPLAIVLPLLSWPELGRSGVVRGGVLVLGALAVVMAPWIARNSLVFHAFIPGVTNGGIGFWGGTAPIGGQLISSLADPQVPDSLRRAVGAMGELEGSRWLYREGAHVIAADPARYARLLVRKFFQLWLNLGFDRGPSRASIAIAIAHVAAVALAVLGLMRIPHAPGVGRIMAGLAIVWTLVHLPFVVVVRYAVPFYVALFTCAAAGLVVMSAGRLNEELWRSGASKVGSRHGTGREDPSGRAS